MRLLPVSVIALAALTCSCSVVPRQEDITRISTYDIVQRVRCEAQRAIVEYEKRSKYKYQRPTYYRKATIAYEFDFDVTEINNAEVGASWGFLYPLGGSFVVDAGAGSNRTRYTKRNIKVTDTFNQALAMDCDKTPPPSHENIVYPIEGNIGVYELVTTFVDLQQVQNKFSGNVFTFGDTLTFTTIFHGGVQPKVVIAPLTDGLRLAGVNGDFNARRQDIHKVALTLAGDPEKMDDMSVEASVQKLPPFLSTNSSLADITLMQARTGPTLRALLELDRQRILALQNRAQSIIVGQ